MRSVCELALHPQQQPKRMAHSAALLTSCFALLLSIILWSNVRAGCRAEAMALAAGGGAEALGMLGGSDAGIGSELPGGGSVEQQLREQQQRVRDLEIILADERSEAQTIRFERASLVREKEQAEQQRQEAERDKQALLTEAQSALYADSLVMGHLIRANRTALKRDWQARLAGQRQRGIVLSAGSTLPLTNAFITLHVLRNHLKCALPVAIMYWGASKADTVDNSSIAFFKEHLRDVEFINASALAYPDYHRPLSPDLPNGAFQGWKVKVFSIYAAPFQEVLYLDSDSTPLLDPSTLFATEQYRRFGNLFWADFYAGDVPWIKAEKLFEVLKVESPWSPARGPKTARQAETGQLLLHRGWHWEVLEWLLFLNTHDEVTYRTAHGDKDTFRAAFHLAGRAGMYQQVAHYPALTLTDTVVKERRYHQRGVVQLHPNGSLLFHHKAGPLGKFDLQRLEPIPATTHVTARASADLGTACVFSGSLVNEAIGGMYEKQVLLVTPSTCNYTMYDWPASQAACAPGYDQNLPGTTQKLPIFEVTPTSHLARAEAAAEAAFGLMESSRIWGPEILTVFGTWGPDV